MNIIDIDGQHVTAATNTLQHEADIAKVQEWLGPAGIPTARMYDTDFRVLLGL